MVKESKDLIGQEYILVNQYKVYVLHNKKHFLSLELK